MNTRTFLVAALAVILVVDQHMVLSSSDVCDSLECVQEAAKIANYIDPEANPCEDFHQFACGNVHHNSTDAVDEIIELLEEDIQETDHKMVQFMKKFYQSCMNRVDVQDDLKTVNEVLKKLGGWPVLEGSSWNEHDFDWFKLTFALRRAGYDYDSLLSVDVTPDPDNSSKYLLKIDGGYRTYPPLSELDMTGVAVLFGAEDEAASKEYRDVFEFIQKLNHIHMDRISNNTHEKHTIEEINHTDGIIDWLEFINTVTGPVLKMTSNDHVMFPNKQYMKHLFGLVLDTPKRTISNYMMWTGVKPLVRFLRNCPSNNSNCPRGKERSMTCIAVAYDRFDMQVPTPMDVIRLRKHLPLDKKEKIENLISNVQSASVDVISKIQWIDEKNKQDHIDKMKEANVVVGMNANYFDDEILDYAATDLVESDSAVPTHEDLMLSLAKLHGFQGPEKNSFITLLAQAERNFQSAKFIRVHNPISKYYHNQELLNYQVPYYLPNSNTLYVPLKVTSFYENRPEYLNYGTLGTLVAVVFFRVLWYSALNNLTDDTYDKIKPCLLEEMEQSISVGMQQNMLMETITATVADHVAYSAYEEWEKNNGVGPNLISTEYTPKQLFWIAAGSVKCQATSETQIGGYFNDMFSLAKEYSVSASVRQNPSFANDFECPVNSRLNPPKRCNVIV